ncbi:hypothetical protein ACFLWU_03370 [Chloroflexota bacterium]
MNRLTAKGIIKNLDLLIREQGGQALPLALAMLAVGSLTVVPLLNLTETALRSGMREERQMYEHYAANAGVMDGIREIITDNPNIPPHGENWTYNYSISDTNNRSVDVILSTIDQTNWKISSTTTSGSGDSTELECWVEKPSLPPNALTSNNIWMKSSSTVNGDIQYDSDNGSLTMDGTLNGNIKDEAINWPTLTEVQNYYLEELDGEPTHEGNLILNLASTTLDEPYSLGPIHITGYLLINAVPQGGAVRLDGTVYVDGYIFVGRDVVLDLNNNTIFANITKLEIVADTTIIGDGNIIAAPWISMGSSQAEDANLIIWSINNYVALPAGGNLFGTALAPTQITLEPGTAMTWQRPSSSCPIPPFDFSSSQFRIIGWESNNN